MSESTDEFKLALRLIKVLKVGDTFTLNKKFSYNTIHNAVKSYNITRLKNGKPYLKVKTESFDETRKVTRIL